MLMNKTKMKTHWLADMTPISKTQVERVAALIEAYGQEQPILMTSTGKVVDGRHRFLACEQKTQCKHPALVTSVPPGEPVAG